MRELIIKKRGGHELSEKEINFIVAGATDGSIPDYQLSAFLMAVYFKGMSRRETVWLTLAMARSGDMLDLSGVPGVKADKHSTGGVGDKTTLIVAPIVASLGVKVAKMSGRGLGHTGGTVDKLEAIPGFRTELPKDEFIRIVKEIGVCVVGQSGSLAPADKKLYALRDVTGTVENTSLIAASIMSKKLAAGADCILLDVKSGTGAFMKTVEEARKLAEVMVAIGGDAGRNTVALITDMNRPLGNAIGNALEVIEAIDVLSNNGPEDLRGMCVSLAANMLEQAGKGSLEACAEMAAGAIADGSGLETFRRMVKAQGGDLEAPGLRRQAPCYPVLSPCSGYIQGMDTERCGLAAMILGAGRETKESVIDHSAGVMLVKKTGGYVETGEVVARLYTNRENRVGEAAQVFLSGLEFGSAEPPSVPVVYGRVAGEIS